MGKILKPKLKLCRREKIDLFLTSGITDIKKKCNLNQLPGVSKNKLKLSDFNLKLREKQKIKRMYGLRETQLKNIFLKTKNHQNRFISLFQILESRLDNVIYRSGLALTRAHARQLINHKLIYVNQKKIFYPSYQVKPNDEILFSNKLKNNILICQSIELKKNKISNWITLNLNDYIITINSYPNIDNEFNIFNEDLIIELYSR